MNKFVRIGAFVLGAVVLTIVIIRSGPELLWQSLRDSAWGGRSADRAVGIGLRL